MEPEMSSTNDGDGITIWRFECPACGDVSYKLPPEEGDEVECPECDWSDEILEIDLNDDYDNE